ncbi:M20/M25/M40 family metallo-hydrolase [Microbacterium elymi]|uniref:Amidohydrolase n=1 Tax=Microbacterium elymi TaxID=2909587 RepID=A0ABY5NL98_9MICO|nr:M20/M25/M40 family metallo-hydrolase [Microbacterium elymi]UUT35927.1 hypothetical protein L2X98_22545 [Microbacterium elymi]
MGQRGGRRMMHGPGEDAAAADRAQVGGRRVMRGAGQDAAAADRAQVGGRRTMAGAGQDAAAADRAQAAAVDPGAGRGPAWLDAALAEHLPALVGLRRRIHAHPELSRHETATTALIHDTLTAADIPAQVLPGGTGVVAEIAGRAAASHPVIGLRADIDALPLIEGSGLPFASTVPGVAHACGHDLHTTVPAGRGAGAAVGA